MEFESNDKLKVEFITCSKQIAGLNKQIKKDGDKTTIGFVPIALPQNYFLIGIRDNTNNQIVSFIYFGIRENFEGFNKILFVNYSYTFISYRKKGLNKKLRLFLEKFCKQKKIKAIVSVPFPESESRIVMNKLGYLNKIADIYIKKIN